MSEFDNLNKKMSGLIFHSEEFLFETILAGTPTAVTFS
jgi:hypothetical protein